MNKKTLILIDGNAIMHRAYHALPPLNTKTGELVNAVYGFTSTILSVIAQFKPEYIAASFDLAGPTFRHDEYKEYKATRVKAPDEFYVQIPRVKEVVETLNIPIYEKQGYEADDVIGTLSFQALNNNEIDEVIIVTGDLDTLQLVNDKTKVYTMRRGLSDSVLYDLDKVKERYGIAPEQLKDFKGLRGDPSDNIPGVKGIGEKIAGELLQKYGTLEKVYEHLGEIKGANHDKLERDKIQAFMSKQLGTIKTDVPVNLELDKTAVHDFDRQKVVALFNELNFYSLVKRLPTRESGTNEKRIETNEKNDTGMTNNGVKDFKYEAVEDKDIDSLITELKEQKEIALVIDDSGIAFSWKTGRAYYINNFKFQISNFKLILEDENIKKTGYDLKTIYKELKKVEIVLKGMDFDVMIAAYVLDPGGKVDFPALVFRELGEEYEEKKGQLGLGLGDIEETSKGEEICRRADYIFKLKEIYEKKINEISQQQGENNLRRVMEEIEIPLVPILAEMEINGIKVNGMVLEGISETIGKNILTLEKNIYKLAGKEFNINSPQQLSEILFDVLKLPTEDIKKNKTGYSTASGELDKLRDKHKIIEKVEEYRELFKLKTTYLDTLPGLISSDGRIHTSFNQAVTATGRLSSSEPNLQNIPIRTDLGQIMRTSFVAEDGFKLVSADYSQIDLRAVAHVSADNKMIEAFHRGDDIHRLTAVEINKVTLSQVTEKMRRAAKTLNFGVIYGMSVFGFSQAAGIEREEAKKFIDAYMEKFSGVAKYMRETKESAKRKGYVETLLGRRRNIPEINSPNFQVQNAAERMAINMPIQGLSADIVKIAMIKLTHELIELTNEGTNKKRMDTNDTRPVKSGEAGVKQFNGVRMILQIHDEIILEVKEEMADEVAQKVKEIMEQAYQLKVPLVAEVKIGDNWGEV
jgi:DNA polymerase I